MAEQMIFWVATWDVEAPPAPGWYPVLICYDESEGVFPSARRYGPRGWDGRGVLAFGPRCDSEDEAQKLADEHETSAL